MCDKIGCRFWHQKLAIYYLLGEWLVVTELPEWAFLAKKCWHLAFWIKSWLFLISDPSVHRHFSPTSTWSISPIRGRSRGRASLSACPCPSKRGKWGTSAWPRSWPRFCFTPCRLSTQIRIFWTTLSCWPSSPGNTGKQWPLEFTNFSRTWGQVLSREYYCFLSSEWLLFLPKIQRPKKVPSRLNIKKVLTWLKIS